MLSTDDSDVRNQLAMDLAETGDLRVKAALLSLIQRPDLTNRRGTLVYALESFDCGDQAPLLLELVTSGNFEVALLATNIIAKTAQFPAEHTTLLVTGLEDLACVASEDWRRASAENLLDGLAS